MKIALGVEYDGAQFSGWEGQPRRRTVQGELEKALSAVADRPTKVICAGRTDAGVHAWGQVVHFETEVTRELRAWLLGGNANLPDDVSLTWARSAADDFHARFSARGRHYRYVICNRRTRPAVLRQRVCWEHRPLAVEAMQEGAGHLLGEHDFSSFRAVACQAKSPVRQVRRLEVSQRGVMIFIDVVANGFLHHMVRNMAGVLMAIGMGRQAPAWSRDVLKARDRTRGGVTAPPDGLYLMGVEYPLRFGLPRVFPSPLVW